MTPRRRKELSELTFSEKLELMERSARDMPRWKLDLIIFAMEAHLFFSRYGRDLLVSAFILVLFWTLTGGPR
jgi:hypothetical protein